MSVIKIRKLSRSVPAAVTRFQALAALTQAGLLEEIEAYMVADTVDWLTKLAWKECLNFERGSQMIADIATLFGLSDEQVDDLFCFAETIK